MHSVLIFIAQIESRFSIESMMIWTGSVREAIPTPKLCSPGPKGFLPKDLFPGPDIAATKTGRQ